MNKNFVFESERLTYRGITTDDAADIVRWRSSFEIIKYFLNPHPLTAEKHSEWYQKYLFDDSRFDFIMINKINKKKIGSLSIYDIDYAKRNAGIAYLIGESEYQHKGYALEAVQRVKEIVFEENLVECVFIVSRIDNKASASIAIKAGFIKNNDKTFKRSGNTFESYYLNKNN